MFESRHRSGGGNSANRWLVVAGAGLVILAFVARMLLDIGQTRVSDLAGVLRPDSATAATPVPAPAPAVDTVAVTPVREAAPTAAPSAPLPDSVAATPVASPPPVPAPVPSASGRVVIQIGAFGSEANATKLSQRASAIGYEATVIPQVRGNTTLYLVRVIRAGTPAEARIVSDSLAHALGVNAVVLRPGQ
jgi:cell division septation protein DedD